jgi:hypothetical protein
MWKILQGAKYAVSNVQENLGKPGKGHEIQKSDI